ncbi:Rad9-domain-containing protein [Sparassis latifolia]
MVMQATLDATALKHLTRALICLSKYGDDLTIYATPQTLALSATNSSMSAYCRFKYDKQFFSKYNVGNTAAAGSSRTEVEEVPTATGQLLTKSLLSILKHRTVEKTVEKCELAILDGVQDGRNDENEDTLESRLITHRLLLLAQTCLMAPGMLDTPCQSRLTIGPRALKDMIEHFPSAKGSKSDPQLIWNFADSEVSVRSLETSIDTKGRAQLATELIISADEFNVYDIYTLPTTIAFHLREFNATIAFAESSAHPLDIRFTDPAAPLYIDVEGDLSETLFVISTSQIHGVPSSIAGQARQRNITSVGPQTRGKKRQLEDDSNASRANSGMSAGQERVSRPMKVVQATDRASLARELSDNNARGTSRSLAGSMPPPSLPLATPSQNAPPTPRPREPLFFPSSQLSQAAQDAIRESGLGIENMTAEEFEAMLEGDGEEVGLDPDEELGNLFHDVPSDAGQDSLDIYDVEMEPTQSDEGTKAFKPLFED